MSSTHGTPARAPFGAERRAFPRFRVRDRILGHLIDADRPVRLRDIGFGGFATETVEPLPLGGVHPVRLTAEDDQTVTLKARALHNWPSCFDDGTPCFVTGFAFIDNTAEDRDRIERLIGFVTSFALFGTRPDA
jgi:hypothetical protein